MKKTKVIVGLLLTGILLVTASCGASTVSEEREEEGIVVETSGKGIQTERDYEMENEKRAPAVISEGAMPISGTGAGESWDDERMIVRTGQMVMVVNEVPVVIDQITSLAETSHGYVVSSRVWKSGEKLVGSISIRIPADDYTDVMEILRTMSVEVLQEITNSSDVTEEYVDLTSKLDNLEATETQLLAIMEKAETVEDILEVQAQLSKVRGEIEQTKGRMQYLERTSAMSLIEIQLQESSIEIEFTADKWRKVKENEKIQFTVHEISGGFPPYTYEWDFGDGEISTDENPTHAYVEADYYTVSLTVTDDEGNSDTLTRDEYIYVIRGWNAGSIASAAWNGLVGFGQALANFFIWIGVFFPLWIVIGAIVFGVMYWRRRNKKRNANTDNP
jgi:PKD repeat protein